MEQYGYSYSAIGDILAMAVAITNWLLLASSYSVKKYSLTLFKIGNVVLMFSAIMDMSFFKLMDHVNEQTIHWFMLCHILCFASLLILFNAFLYYVLSIVGISEQRQKKIKIGYMCFTGFIIILQGLEPFLHFGLFIDENYNIHYNAAVEPFRYAYVFYLLTILYFIAKYRKRFITSMFHCLNSIVALSFLIMLLQELFRSRSFTVFTFTLPVIAVLFLFHHNAFDQETGTLDDKAFDGYIQDLGKKDFSIIYLCLKEVHPEKMNELMEVFYHFNEDYFKKPVTFRKGQKRMILVYTMDENPNAGTKQVQLLNDFEHLYNKYQMDYKIIMLRRTELLKSGEDYFNMLDFLENSQKWNTVYQSKESDVGALSRSMSVLKQLKDIQTVNDLDDERVLVYCQPVLCVSGHKFTTAEALMRLQLPDMGIVYPDQFISLAERYDYIHVLSRIILNKTCRHIKMLLDEGYDVERISVNFSIEELKNPEFCEDVLSIVERNHIPFNKVAIELTESRDLESFEMVRKSMLTLHKYGIHFYLDDFGTGYSNFERILGLPVDIIKFDRSLTIKSAENAVSNYMVGSFSTIFKKADYQVLFEGVESEKDEVRCIEMSADYLQGYRYSKPVPIEELSSFFEKKNIL